ncbi:uncharacterized protein EDB91DRAFT_1246765 [Suillus paluster]|uniref:uncharacterized protein n=1 Tax=Suillus paluster TaxID=48578 RepID=UPI001B87E850|nr:uncharacterized protein EDB91DRAFT_1246765 [Suillus paluster]KAG1744649.1 hypothetical protein EDB91DRAFT_1246765 [Suillus paluster]
MTYQNRIGDTSAITSHELISLILEKSTQRKEKLCRKGHGKDNALTMKEKNLKKKCERKEVKKCRICKKSGHTDQDCWFKDKQTKCSNCHKSRHAIEMCWSKGGGQAGTGPSKPSPLKRAKKDNTNVVEDINDVAEDAQYYEEEDVAFLGDDMEEVVEEQPDVPQANYSQGEYDKLIKFDWLADSGTTSHITKIKSALMDYVPLKSHKVTGISNQSIKAEG